MLLNHFHRTVPAGSSRCFEVSRMHEYVGNMHMHTTASDGHGTHDEVADAAIQAQLDFIVITDHNLLPEGLDGYYFRGHRPVLRLIGQEVHDERRVPEKSHLLVYGAGQDLSKHAADPQGLIKVVRQTGGMSFLAHPSDCAVPRYGQQDLSWDDWDVVRFTGLELWNFMTAFKCQLRTRAHALYYALFPSQVRCGPPRTLLERWDRMLIGGQRVVAIGNSDAHALPVNVGPLRRTIFPYEWLFKAVNTHILTEKPLTGDAEADAMRIYEAIQNGRCFVANDLRADARGFMFSGHSEFGNATMGDRLRFRLGATLQISTPRPADLRLIRHGEPVRSWKAVQHGVQSIAQPGAYRVEARMARPRGSLAWIYSNPIYAESV